MSNHKHSGSLRTISFDEKAAFCASQTLALRQSKEFTALPRPVKPASVWDQKAPDFSPKLYKSLDLPQKKHENRHSPLTESSSDTFNKITKWTMPTSPDTCLKKVPVPFILRHRPPDSLESKLMFVKFGKYPNCPYTDPKPHDFRQYSDDMPGIVTTFEKDPSNLNFKSLHLSTSRHTSSTEDIHQCERLWRFNTFKSAEPKWHAKLILPKNPWPNKSASYTRHRRRKGVYSAFMDRVEEKLAILWKNS